MKINMHFIPSVKDTMAEHEREQLTGSKPQPLNPICDVRPVTAETFKTLNGITKLYQLNVASRGWMFCRSRPCWCLACLADVMECDHSDMSETYDVEHCTSSPFAPTHFTYHLKGCRKTKGKAVDAPLANVGEKGIQGQVENICHGDWILQWNAGDGDVLWLGRAVNCSEWLVEGGERAVLVNKGPGAKNMKNVGVGKVEIRKGESGVNVQWYVREGDGEVMDGEKESLKYVMADFPPCVQNSKYFVHCRFQEHVTLMKGQQAMLRSSRRLAVGVEQYRENDKGHVVKNYTTTAKNAKAQAMLET